MRLLDLRLLDLRLLDLRLRLLMLRVLRLLMLRHPLQVWILRHPPRHLILLVLILLRRILARPPFRRIQIQCVQRYTFFPEAVLFLCLHSGGLSKLCPGCGKLLLPPLLLFALNKILYAAFLQHFDLPVQPLFSLWIRFF